MAGKEIWRSAVLPTHLSCERKHSGIGLIARRSGTNRLHIAVLKGNGDGSLDSKRAAFLFVSWEEGRRLVDRDQVQAVRASQRGAPYPRCGQLGQSTQNTLG